MNRRERRRAEQQELRDRRIDTRHDRLLDRPRATLRTSAPLIPAPLEKPVNAAPSPDRDIQAYARALADVRRLIEPISHSLDRAFENYPDLVIAALAAAEHGGTENVTKAYPKITRELLASWQRRIAAGETPGEVRHVPAPAKPVALPEAELEPLPEGAITVTEAAKISGLSTKDLATRARKGRITRITRKNDLFTTGAQRVYLLRHEVEALRDAHKPRHKTKPVKAHAQESSAISKPTKTVMEALAARGGDPELECMTAVTGHMKGMIGELDKLDPEARARVVFWISKRWPTL